MLFLSFLTKKWRAHPMTIYCINRLNCSNRNSANLRSKRNEWTRSIGGTFQKGHMPIKIINEIITLGVFVRLWIRIRRLTIFRFNTLNTVTALLLRTNPLLSRWFPHSNKFLSFTPFHYHFQTFGIQWNFCFISQTVYRG